MIPTTENPLIIFLRELYTIRRTKREWGCDGKKNSEIAKGIWAKGKPQEKIKTCNAFNISCPASAMSQYWCLVSWSFSFKLKGKSIEPQTAKFWLCSTWLQAPLIGKILAERKQHTGNLNHDHSEMSKWAQLQSKQLFSTRIQLTFLFWTLSCSHLFPPTPTTSLSPARSCSSAQNHCWK